MRIQKRGILLHKVLATIGNAALALAKNPGRTTGSLYRAIREFDDLQSISDEQLRNVSNYVVRKKYIVIRRSGSHAEIQLTEYGKKAFGLAAIRQMKPVKPQKWDGKWRIVVFDIPDFAKYARDGFAGTLKRLGFFPMQKSVFLCPYPCEEELEVIADYFKVSDYIDLILADKISRSDVWRKIFDI